MLTYWYCFSIILIPFIWSTSKSIKEKSFVDALLQFLLLLCVMVHFFTFWKEFHLGIEPGIRLRVTNQVSSVLILPYIYAYAAKRLDLLKKEDIIKIILPILLMVIMRGNINIGTEEMAAVATKIFHFDIYYNNTLLMTLKIVNVVMVLQMAFSTYKLYTLTIRMRQMKYHYSRNVMYFGYLAVTGLLMGSLSFVPKNTIWRDPILAYIFLFIMFGLIGTGYVFLALGMDRGAIKNDSNETVSMAETSQFKELGKSFQRYITEEKVYLQENVHQDDVARALGTNRTYMAKMMKEVFGTTFVNYMNKMRIEEAKRLLAEDENGELKLQDVAWRSGFASTSTFNKVFKAQTGMAPSEYALQRASASALSEK